MTGSSTGGGGSTIFRMPSIRSPVGVLVSGRVTVAGGGAAAADAAACFFPFEGRVAATCTRTRCSATTLRLLLWLLTGTLSVASTSISSLVLSPSSFASSYTRIQRPPLTPTGSLRVAVRCRAQVLDDRLRDYYLKRVLQPALPNRGLGAGGVGTDVRPASRHLSRQIHADLSRGRAHYPDQLALRPYLPARDALALWHVLDP
jgi:hypothetical protein